MLELGRIWIASVIVVLACETAEPAEAASGGGKSKPAAKQAEAPAKPAEPGEAAIQVSVPEESPPPDGARPRGGSVDPDVGAAESFSEASPPPEGPSRRSFGPGHSLADCLSNCETRSLSDDNRATCRLLCKSHYARAEKVDPVELIDAYVGCFDACEDDASCRNRCSNDVARDNACASTCLGAFGRCLTPCDGGGDSGRCTERCETTARSCVGAC